MLLPKISVVIETVTARDNGANSDIASDIAALFEALGHQTYPAAQIERLIVVDPEVSAAERESLARQFAPVCIIEARAANYFAAKNAGIAAANADIVVLVDGDCVPAADWLERLARRFEPDVVAVAGKTRYAGPSLAARTFSVPDFAYVVTQPDGQASGFLINNLALRRSALPAAPFDARIPRNGGCTVLFHQLRAAGARLVFEPQALVTHVLDVGGISFVGKHFERGRDGAIIYRLDDRGLFRGTAVVRRFGVLGLAALTARHILLDWQRLLRHRRQIGVSWFSLPFYCLVAASLRSIELCGGCFAILSHYPERAADGTLQPSAQLQQGR